MTYSQPSSSMLAVRLQAAIDNNTPATALFYDFLQGSGIEANFIRSALYNNPDVIRVITSPKGRVWIKNNINAFLNYLEKFR
jgi:hypothetical protein